MLYLDDDEYDPPETIPYRGRVSRGDTDHSGSFTASELDTSAPLTADDLECLRADRYYYHEPRPETKERLQNRILAARAIKYGR